MAVVELWCVWSWEGGLGLSVLVWRMSSTSVQPRGFEAGTE